MKKLMCILQIALFAIMAIAVVAYTIGSIVVSSDFYAWQVALIVLSGLSILLVGVSVREYKNECNQ